MDDSVRRFQAFTKEDCRKLQVLQNKVLRMKCGNFVMNAPTNDILCATGDLPVHQLGAYQTLVTAFRVIKTGEPRYLAEMLVPKKPSSKLLFRSRHLDAISVTYVLSISRAGIIYRAASFGTCFPYQ